jgi:hypothetical protein
MTASRHIVVRRDYLGDNRQMIISRSLVAALAGSMPIPVFEDWLASRVYRGTIRRIAAARGIDVDEGAVRAIADGESTPPSWTSIAAATFVARALRRSWRKLFITYLAAQRARYAAQSFSSATLFDHYCARLHVGLGLDAESGARVRTVIGETLADTKGGLITRMFRQGVLASARATVRAPVELLDMASGGALRRLLGKGDEVDAVAAVDDAIERSTTDEQGFLVRAVAAIEGQMSAEGNPYLEALLSGFETRWRARDDA